MTRAWALLLVAAGAVSCGGKVYLDTPGAGGTGGSGGDGASAPSTGSSSSAGGAGGSGGAPGCVRCGDFLADPTLGTGQFCASSQPIYDTMHACICETTCASLCAANVCEGFSIDIPCNDCLSDTSANGCGAEYAACSSD